MYFSEEEIDGIVKKQNIIDWVSKYVKIEKKGDKWFGLCPFHKETFPSFMVDEEKQEYYCFGCGKGGNIITFLMDYLDISFLESIYMLGAKHQNIDDKIIKMKQEILEACNLASIFYMSELSKNELAMKYVKKRKLSDETIKKFKIGYANNNKQDLYKFLKKNRINDQAIKESGLFSFYDDGTVVSKFIDRFMFPIQDQGGKTIGFGGRLLVEKNEDKKDNRPKYLNSPETVIFDKSSNLFGLNFAKDTSEDFFIVCEGYMDVISLHQGGFSNAVASLGTALTLQQAKLMKRYKNKVVLAYDSDGPGQTAAKRALGICSKVGIECSFINMNPYKDPDEFIKNLGTREYQSRIENALSMKQWVFQKAEKEKDKDLINMFFE